MELIEFQARKQCADFLRAIAKEARSLADKATVPELKQRYELAARVRLAEADVYDPNHETWYSPVISGGANQ